MYAYRNLVLSQILVYKVIFGKKGFKQKRTVSFYQRNCFLSSWIGDILGGIIYGHIPHIFFRPKMTNITYFRSIIETVIHLLRNEFGENFILQDDYARSNHTQRKHITRRKYPNNELASILARYDLHWTWIGTF